MLRYVVLGKYSQDFLSGLIYNPQDRKKAAAAMMKKAGAEWAEGESYLHINHPNYDFVGIVQVPVRFYIDIAFFYSKAFVASSTKNQAEPSSQT